MGGIRCDSRVEKGDVWLSREPTRVQKETVDDIVVDGTCSYFKSGSEDR